MASLQTPEKRERRMRRIRVFLELNRRGGEGRGGILPQSDNDAF